MYYPIENRSEPLDCRVCLGWFGYVLDPVAWGSLKIRSRFFLVVCCQIWSANGGFRGADIREKSGIRWRFNVCNGRVRGGCHRFHAHYLLMFQASLKKNQESQQTFQRGDWPFFQGVLTRWQVLPEWFSSLVGILEGVTFHCVDASLG